MGLIAALFLASSALAISPEVASRFVAERLWVLDPFSAASADLREELEEEIARLLDRYDDGGPLRPAYFSVGITEGWALYGYPGEAAYILADALPYLSAAVRERLMSALYDWVRDADPTVVAFNHCDWGWGSCELTGNRREFFPLPTSPTPDPLTPNLWPPPQVPVESLYMLWRYADATGDWDFLSETNPPSGERWTRILNLFAAIPNPATRYGEVAAALGAARIFRHFGLTNDALYATALQRIEAGMLAGLDFDAFVDASYDAFLHGTHDWAWTPFHYLRVNNAVGAMMAPEIGRFLGEFAGEAVHRRTTYNADEDQPDQTPAIESNWRGWFLTRGYYPPLIPWMGYYGENHMVTPDTPWALFMTHAWVYGATGDALRAYLDVPYCVGDLFHLQRLTATIEAYGNPVWGSVQPPILRAAPGGGWQSFQVVGSADGFYAVERSDEWGDWLPLFTNAGPSFIVINTPGPTVRVFRARSVP